MICFVLGGWPPSINASHFARGRVLKPETRRWIEQTGLILLGQYHDQKRTMLGAKLTAEQVKDGCEIGLQIRLYGKWRTKNGKTKRIDLSNRIKLLEDTVSKVASFDDSQVHLIRAEKIEAEAERTEVDVYELYEMP